MDNLKEGTLIEFNAERGTTTIWVHYYRLDNRNPFYIHPLGPLSLITIPPPLLGCISAGMTGIFIKTLPLAVGWHQWSDVDCLVLVGEELYVVSGTFIKKLK